MGINTIPMRTFLATLEKWVRAVEDRKTADARFFVEQLLVASEMLAFDPEFKRIFEDNRKKCGSQNPEEIIKCVYDFFHAVTDAGQPGRYRPNSHDGSAEEPGALGK